MNIFSSKSPFQFLLFISLLLTFTAGSTGCKSTKPATKDTDKLPQALLWKIVGKGIKEPSYLFGTIHMIDKDDYFLPSGFDEAFESCDQVVFEIDMDDMTDMSAIMSLLTDIVMKNGMTLNKLLSPSEYKEVSAYFENMGLPMFLLNKVKPMFLFMLADVNMNPEEMQSDEIVSYEMNIYDKANEENKEVGGLETMAYQMSLFDSIPYKDQAKMLLDAVRGTSTEEGGSLDETAKLYKEQNIEAMVAMMSEDEGSGVAGYEDILLNNRNNNWLTVMPQKMTKGPTFFAVGAGHLGGPNGMVRLLKKAGYTMTPVSVYKANAAKKI
jgi:uncharacterized protein YbaP (TraB family)